jgi:hypothetical protein
MNRLAASALIIVMITSVSCVLAVVDTRRPERLNISLSQLNRNVPLKSGGSIFLENTVGDIKIEGWDEESVEVVVEENMGLPRSPHFYFFGRSHPKPDIQIENSEEEIRIRTPRSAEGEVDRLFDYHLKVPRSVNLQEIRNGEGDIQISDIYGSARIKGERGDIRVRNFSGPLDVDLESGDVEAELLDLRPQDEVMITVGDGDIALYLEPGSGAELEAGAPAGDVSSEFDIAEPLPARSVSAKLGEGGARISLTARRGDIKIMRIEE